MDEWTYAVGNFILNFGVLELHVFDFLQANLPAAEFAGAKQKSFSTRLKSVGNVLGVSKENSVAYQEWQKRLDPLKELRNQIAHGYMSMQIDYMPDRPTLTVANARGQNGSDAWDSASLTTSALFAESRKVGELGEEFCRLVRTYSEGGLAAAT